MASRNVIAKSAAPEAGPVRVCSVDLGVAAAVRDRVILTRVADATPFEAKGEREDGLPVLASLLPTDGDTIEKSFPVIEGVVPKLRYRGLVSAVATPRTVARMIQLVSAFPNEVFNWHTLLYLMFTPGWDEREPTLPEVQSTVVGCDFPGFMITNWGTVAPAEPNSQLVPVLGTSEVVTSNKVMDRFRPIRPDLVVMHAGGAPTMSQIVHHSRLQGKPMFVLEHHGEHSAWGHYSLYETEKVVTINIGVSVRLSAVMVQLIDEFLRLVAWVALDTPFEQVPLSRGFFGVMQYIANSNSSTRTQDLIASVEILRFLLDPNVEEAFIAERQDSRLLPWSAVAKVPANVRYDWLSEQFIRRMSWWDHRRHTIVPSTCIESLLHGVLAPTSIIPVHPDCALAIFDKQAPRVTTFHALKLGTDRIKLGFATAARMPEHSVVDFRAVGSRMMRANLWTPKRPAVKRTRQSGQPLSDEVMDREFGAIKSGLATMLAGTEPPATDWAKEDHDADADVDNKAPAVDVRPPIPAKKQASKSVDLTL